MLIVCVAVGRLMVIEETKNRISVYFSPSLTASFRVVVLRTSLVFTNTNIPVLLVIEIMP